MPTMLRLLSAALFPLIAILGRASDEKLGLIFNSSTFDFYKFIEETDALTLYSLDPAPQQNSEKKLSTEEFHSYRVLGKVEGKSAAAKEGIRNALLSAFSDLKDPYMCFEPRHAIRLVRRDEVMDVLLCYECQGSKAHFKGAYQFGPLSGQRGEAYFNALLAENRIPQASPAAKNRKTLNSPTNPAAPSR